MTDAVAALAAVFNQMNNLVKSLVQDQLTNLVSGTAKVVVLAPGQQVVDPLPGLDDALKKAEGGDPRGDCATQRRKPQGSAPAPRVQDHYAAEHQGDRHAGQISPHGGRHSAGAGAGRASRPAATTSPGRRTQHNPSRRTIDETRRSAVSRAEARRLQRSESELLSRVSRNTTSPPWSNVRGQLRPFRICLRAVTSWWATLGLNQ